MFHLSAKDFATAMSMLNTFPAPAVKMCGLKSEAAIDAAVDGGAAFVGLVFFEKSPRHVDLATAGRLADHARDRVKIVALTVDASNEEIARIVHAVRPDLLQLHGHETPERVAEVKDRFQRPIIKALPVATTEDVVAADAYLDTADIILFDAKPVPGAVLPGGNGLAFDWRLLEPLAGRYPFMLSGGLTAQNVGEAIRRTGAEAVDVSSGVESAPGVKDTGLIRQFLDAAHTSSHGPG